MRERDREPCAYAVCRVVAYLLSLSERCCRKSAIGNTFDLQMEKKKKHAYLQRHTCLHTPTQTHTQVCLFPAGVICNSIGMLHRLTSKFYKMLPGEKQACVQQGHAIYQCCTFYQKRPVKTPLVTARVALLKFNQVLFALTFQSMRTVHIVFKVVSLCTHRCVWVC